jgi:hypothetical protein
VVVDSSAVIGNYVVVEHVVSTNDTFKVHQLATISRVLATKMSDWSVVTCTAAGNTVTVTQAGLSNVKIVALVAGNK